MMIRKLKNTKRYLLAAILGVAACFSGFAFEGQWRLHPTFDGNVERLLDTPKYVYMLALAQPYSEGVPESPSRQGFLYIYDKENDEFRPLNSEGSLSQSVISRIDYNSRRGYLLIIYEDLNIDLLFDDGKVVNIPALKAASIPTSKNINGVFFDSDHGYADIATDFGFIIIDDNKGEIYESRIYNRPITSIARCGDQLFISDEEQRIYHAPATAPNFTFDAFTPVNFVGEGPGKVKQLFRLSSTKVGILSDLPEDSETPQEIGFIELYVPDTEENPSEEETPSEENPSEEEVNPAEGETTPPEGEVNPGGSEGNPDPSEKQLVKKLAENEETAEDDETTDNGEVTDDGDTSDNEEAGDNEEESGEPGDNEGDDEEDEEKDLLLFKYTPSTNGTYRYITEGKNGPLVWETTRYCLISAEGVAIGYSIPAIARSGVTATYDGQSFWNTNDRSGLRQISGGDKPAVTKGFMRPDSPAVYISQDMVYSPKYGMLVSNRGNVNYFSTVMYYRPILLSGLKDNSWVMHGLPYTNPERSKMMFNPNGLAIDPKNPDMVYFGSLISGIGRVNLSDPKDVLHMSTWNDQAASYPEFVDMLPVSDLWTRSARMGAPKFDSAGNLWSIFNHIDSENPSELWVWPRANIDATKDAQSFKPWLKIPLKTSNAMSWNSMALPLTSSGNTNRILAFIGTYQTGLILVDHKGTFSNTADDIHLAADNLFDQDNQPNNYNYIRTMTEDPSTGLVWVGCDNGVFTVNPNTFAANPGLINRIKVARDDGTSLADYLLNGVDVSSILIDPLGRKWFGTVGGGLVCTSADGRTVKGEWTKSNSPLPDNNVYGLGWNEDTGSLMISTGKGLVEFFPSGEGNGKDFESMRIFPNPVRPDYFGWVTIDGLTEGALVKITDAHGNMVRELGRVNGGTIQWDVANLNGRRVPSGVYYVLASGGENDSNLTKIGKILVVN